MSHLRVLLPSVVLSVVCLAATVTMIVAAEPAASERASKFVAAHEAKVRPLEIAANLAWWNANTTGKDEDFKKKEEAQNRIDEALADRAAFSEVKKLKEANRQRQIDDPALAREIDVLYLQYLEKQVEPALLKRIISGVAIWLRTILGFPMSWVPEPW